MKISYRANNAYGPEFDDPISCQVFEKVLQFLEDQSEESEWQRLNSLSGGFQGAEHSLKSIVEERHLFKRLMEQIVQAETEL